MAINLSVKGMTCDHCVHSVTRALKSVAGVEDVAVNLAAGQARVDGTVEVPLLVRAIEKAGYKAQVAESR